MKLGWPPLNADERGLKMNHCVGVYLRLSAAGMGFSVCR
jgi:hypothetical protein